MVTFANLRAGRSAKYGVRLVAVGELKGRPGYGTSYGVWLAAVGELNGRPGYGIWDMGYGQLLANLRAGWDMGYGI